MLAQTNPNFRVVVGCHDIPDIPQLQHPQVHAFRVDFPPPERNNDDMCLDKILKLSHGVRWAQEQGASHVMFVDADDLVSNRLSAFVDSHRNGNGWYFDRGYKYFYGDRWLAKQQPHYLICGTGMIARADVLPFSDEPAATLHDRWGDAARNKLRTHPDFQRETINILAAQGMAGYCSSMERWGYPLSPLPFRGAVYILHDDSTSEVAGGDGFQRATNFAGRPAWREALSQVKRGAQWLRAAQPLTPALRREFTIPRPSEIPAQYAG